MKKLMILAVLTALAGCNTVSGVGQDISAGANTVSGWMGG
ncbi:entericidin [Stagnihabitans tardus]|uniref:Entericidin n=1 Tax=Stagnihabitans tardus TaxID=2699202 RepID=A0AAE4Y5J2_9RHOB|nr:entericidin [Stagnihabitans tardus]NBZ86113.1 entericidin [Stagnihabitans tardus]